MGRFQPRKTMQAFFLTKIFRNWEPKFCRNWAKVTKLKNTKFLPVTHFCTEMPILEKEVILTVLTIIFQFKGAILSLFIVKGSISSEMSLKSRYFLLSETKIWKIFLRFFVELRNFLKLSKIFCETEQIFLKLRTKNAETQFYKIFTCFNSLKLPKKKPDLLSNMAQSSCFSSQNEDI